MPEARGTGVGVSLVSPTFVSETGMWADTGLRATHPEVTPQQVADACVLVPVVNPAHITPHSEAFQAVIWHLLVSHPDLKQQPTKWESVGA